MTSISFRSTGQSVIRLTQQQKTEIKRQKDETRRREERRQRERKSTKDNEKPG